MPRALQVVVAVAAVVAAWVFVDLYLRVDLPGVALLLHAVFRAVAAAVSWLDEGDGHRPEVVVSVVAGATLLAVGLGRRGWIWWRLLAFPLVGAQLSLIVVAALMERGVALGVAVGAAAALIGRSWPEARETGSRRLVGIAAAGLTGVVAAVYLAQMMAAKSQGYALVDRLAEMAADGAPLQVGLLVAAGGLAAACAWPARSVLWCVVPAAVAALLGGWLLDLRLHQGAAVVVAPAATLLLVASWPRLVAAPADRRWDVATWPVRLAPFAAVGGLLIATSYALRVFACGAVLEHPALTRVATPAEVFRVAVGGDGGVLALSMRGERRLGRLAVLPEVGSMEYAEPGPVPAWAPDDRALEGQTLASMEELLYAPEVDRFFGTALGGDPDFYSLPTSPERLVNNLLIELSPDAAAVTRSVGIERLCWIGAMAWRPDDERLYLGCEYEPGLHRYDPASGAIEASLTDDRIGDVAAMAVGADGRLYTVAFWSGLAVAEIDPVAMEVTRTARVGGAHYDLAVHDGSGRLFMSSYYGSRVRIVDVERFERAGRIATGFGARALAVDEQRGLLLASSVYDGVIQACDAASGDVLATLSVGGHVKDITVDSERGVAWFWSRCGLFRLDLTQLED